MSDLRLVAFDVDGTLVDSAAHILVGFRSAYEARGLACPPEQVVFSMIGLSLEVAIARLSPELDAAEHGALAEAYRARYDAPGAALPPLFPGARAALDALAARPEVLLAVATAKSRRGLDPVLAAHDLGGMFLSIQTADTHPSKPDPAMLLAALAETGAGAEGAVMVGDTEYDIGMGRNAGFRTVGVAWGHHAPERLKAAGADVVIESFDALVPALDRLWGSA